MECFVLLKSGLVFYDSILPLLMELKKVGAIEKVTIISPNSKTYNTIKKNSTLYKGLNEIGAEFFYLKKYNVWFFDLLYSLWKLKTVLFKPLFIIQSEDVKGGRLNKFLELNRKLFNGKRVLSQIMHPPYDVYKFLVDVDSVVRKERTWPSCEGFDYVISSYKQEQYEELTDQKLCSSTTFLNIGYSRRFDNWTKLIETEWIDSQTKDLDEPYFLFILTAFGGSPQFDYPPRVETLKEVLSVVKEFNPKIKTIFKPHIHTPIVEFKKVLAEFDYQNYEISYEHPLVLSKNAKFVLSYYPSTIFTDIYFSYQCPIIEFSHYDSRMFKKAEGNSQVLFCVDYLFHRDREGLRECIREIINNQNSFNRDKDFLDHHFPRVPISEIASSFMEPSN